MSILNWFWGLRGWLSNLIRFKDAIDYIPSSKEKANSTWCELFIDIPKISALDTANQPLIRSKELSDYMILFDFFFFVKLKNIMTLVVCYISNK